MMIEQRWRCVVAVLTLLCDRSLGFAPALRRHNDHAFSSSLYSSSPISVDIADEPSLTSVEEKGATVAVEELQPQSPSSNIPLTSLALAGSLTTFFADLLMHPVDCIKTLQQSDMGLSLNMLQASQYLWDTSGVWGFYHGFLTYAGADAIAGAFKFVVWESSQKEWKDQRPQMLFTCLSATLAFVASSVLLVPGEMIKNQLQMSKFDGLEDCVQSIAEKSGLLGFYDGYGSILVRDIPYTILELGLYQFFMTFLQNQRERRILPTSSYPLVAAAITGVITAVLTTPLDTIKTKLMVDDYSSYVDCVLQTVDHHGWLSLFAGTTARVAWVAPFTIVYLPTYDFLKSKLEEFHRPSQI